MGRSVHNQHIERLWRDLFTGCVSYFYNLFYHLEGHGLLDPPNNADVLAVHITFLPKLQKQLDAFQHGWCHHRLQTEHNHTPHQLCLRGMLQAENDVMSGLDIDVSSLFYSIVIIMIPLFRSQGSGWTLKVQLLLKFLRMRCS